MSSQTLLRKPFKFYLLWLLGVWLLYVGLTLLAPVTEATTRYNLSLTQLNLLRTTILIPNLLFWAAALFATIRFYRYSSLVHGSPEGQGFIRICRGLRFLFLSLVIPPLIGLVRAFYPGVPDIERAVTIINNYVTIALYLLAFWELWRAGQTLNDTLAGGHPSRKLAYTVMGAVVVIIGVAYAYGIFNNGYRTVSTDPLVRPTYYLSDPLIILTIFLPYILIWILGGFAILNLRSFARQVPGVVYRQSFYSVSLGLSAIIVLSVGLQFLSQLAGFFGHASLAVILSVVYLLLAIIAVGYLFIARGARQLAAIEEI